MVDVSTGYFVAITGGSFLFGSLVTLLIFKLFRFRLPIKMSSWSDVRHGDSPERIRSFQEALLEEEAKIIPQAYLKVPYSKAGIARHFVHDFRGYVVEEKVTGDRNYSILNVSIPPSYWEKFQKSVRGADYVLAAYGHYGSDPGPVLKTEELRYKQPSAATPSTRPPNSKDMFYGLKYMATDEGWGRDEDETFRSEYRFLSKLFEYGRKTSLIREEKGIHPQFKVPYRTFEVSDPVIEFLIHWGKAQIYGTLYKNLTSDPRKGIVMLNEINKKSERNVSFRNVEQVRIELERHKNVSMHYIESGFVEKEKERVLKLVKKLSGSQ